MLLIILWIFMKKSHIEILDDIDILSDILDSGSDKSISMEMSENEWK